MPIRCDGEWASAKHYYIGRYIGIFYKSMQGKYKETNYIDLFSGPGMCRIKPLGEVKIGSPLIAADYEFTKYFFVDTESASHDALRRRFPHSERARFFNKDCNECADEIRRGISDDSINLIIADQTNVQLKFDTIKRLTNGIRADLIIYFPTGVFFNRGLPVIRDPEKIQKVNDFFGDDGKAIKIWKESPQARKNINLAKYYGERLATLDYYPEVVEDKIPITLEEKNVELYWLIFASKHPKGREFWRKIQAIEHDGQRKLPFS